MVKKQESDERQAFAARLNQALDALGIPEWGRQTKAGELFGLSAPGAAKWLKGDSMPETFRFPSVARILKVRVEWLLSGDGDMYDPHPPPALPRVPIIGTTEDGPAPAMAITAYLDIPSNDPDAYSLRAATDALAPRIRAGELVLVEPHHTPQPGDEVALRIADTFRICELVSMHADEVLVKLLPEPRQRELLRLSDITEMHVVTGVFRHTAIQRT